MSIRIEEGMKYDTESLKVMFKLARDTIIFTILDIQGSAPYTVMRYILAKAKKHKVSVTIYLRFNLEKPIDTYELVHILRPYEL
jgi:hypothetical protein